MKVSKIKKKSDYAHQKNLTAQRVEFERKLDTQPKPPKKYWKEPSKLIFEPYHDWDRMYVGKGAVPKDKERDYAKWLYSNVLQKDWNKLKYLEDRYDRLRKEHSETDKKVVDLSARGKHVEANKLLDEMGIKTLSMQNIRLKYYKNIKRSVGEQRLFMEMEKRGLLDVGGAYGWKPPRDSTDKSIKWAKKESEK